MGLDLWFRADVARILQAAHEAMCSTAAAMGDRVTEDIGARERAAGYRQGFGAALRAVSTAFGLTEIDGERDRWRPEVGRVGVVIDAERAKPLGPGAGSD